MRLIDADALISKINDLTILLACRYVHGDVVEDTIKKAPTVEAVPVVRCRECVYLGKAYTWSKDGRMEMHFCEHMPGGTELNGFCWYGERKMDEVTE